MARARCHHHFPLSRSVGGLGTVPAGSAPPEGATAAPGGTGGRQVAPAARGGLGGRQRPGAIVPTRHRQSRGTDCPHHQQQQAGNKARSEAAGKISRTVQENSNASLPTPQPNPNHSTAKFSILKRRSRVCVLKSNLKAYF